MTKSHLYNSRPISQNNLAKTSKLEENGWFTNTNLLEQKTYRVYFLIVVSTLKYTDINNTVIIYCTDEI